MSTPHIDKLIANHRREAFLAFLLFCLALVLGIVSIGIGPVYIDPLTVLNVVIQHVTGADPGPDFSWAFDAIVWTSRAPRIVMALAVGATLAVCGTAIQSMVRNPLADPFVLGISSGASTGAAFAITVWGTAASSALTLSGFAFVGALFAMVLVLVIGGRSGGNDPLRLIMVGIAIGYALNAATGFLIFASDSPEASRSVMFWMMGSLANTHWEMALAAILVAITTIFLLEIAGRHLDAMASGDDTALAVGIKPERVRLYVMIIVSLSVGVMVAGSGIIGFVGLVSPHIGRMLIGSRHRILIPASAGIGAVFLVIADIGARSLFPPQELAIGVVTGVTGAPFLIFLLSRMRRRFSATS
ncbi:iron ABC transporter permease [Cohaesibacter sp. ES.047]|uniref:FecCD family ABC transporter permease n=1 Tax=Cohaesibacter sp. ES.047 TaxID=1798205 RepID=UPI0012FE3590|nr:iron ABC transporter permease [Cohaesibacter sp. ES.047]